MTENLPDLERCVKCPNDTRTRIAQYLAEVANKGKSAEGCEGPHNVAHGVVTSVRRFGNEPSPTKDEFDWNSMTGPARYGSDEPRVYSRTEWTTTERLCGREPHVLDPDEVLESSRIGKNGQRYTTYIKGSEEDRFNRRAMLGVIDLLDNTSVMQDLNSTPDEVDEARQNIADMGFTIEASAGREG